MLVSGALLKEMRCPLVARSSLAHPVHFYCSLVCVTVVGALLLAYKLPGEKLSMVLIFLRNVMVHNYNFTVVVCRDI